LFECLIVRLACNFVSSVKITIKNVAWINVNLCILMQEFVAHSWVSELDPWHCWPPLAGAGLVHVLVREWTPPPHVTEHELQAPQTDHWPSMAAIWQRFVQWAHGCLYYFYISITRGIMALWIPPSLFLQTTYFDADDINFKK